MLARGVTRPHFYEAQYCRHPLGNGPQAALPAATFHRTLDEPIYCPKCDAAYSLVTDFDWAVSRHFEKESRGHVAMLRKAVFLGHADDHRTTHFETNGVVVTNHRRPDPRPSLKDLKPATDLLQ